MRGNVPMRPSASFEMTPNVDNVAIPTRSSGWTGVARVEASTDIHRGEWNERNQHARICSHDRGFGALRTCDLCCLVSATRVDLGPDQAARRIAHRRDAWRAL